MTEHRSPAPIYLIDGSSFLYRAYYALQPMTTPSGMPVQAVFGFCRMLHKLLKEYKPHCLCVVWDGGGKTARHETYPDYKATRQAAPSDLFTQKDYIVKALEYMGISQIQHPGIEADDLMFGVVQHARLHNQSVVLITSDKDMRQIVDPLCTIYDPFQQAMLDEHVVTQKYGFPPHKLPFYFALLGDSSDNIPGVAGVGDKTARELVQQFESLDDLYAHLDRVAKPRTRMLLEASRDNAFLSLDLFTLREPAVSSVVEVLQTCAVPSDAWNRARPLFEELAFKSLLKDIPVEPFTRATQAGEELQVHSFSRSYNVEFITVTSDEQFDAMCAEIEDAGICALDTETDAQAPLQSTLVGISFCTRPGRAYYVPLAHTTKTALTSTRAYTVLKRILEDDRIKKYLHHAKFDMLVLYAQGIDMQGLVFDTLLAASLVRIDGAKINLKDMSYATFGERMHTYKEVVLAAGYKTFDQVPLDAATDYAAADAHQTFKLVDVLKKQLEEQQMTELYRRIELPLVHVLYEMERVGIRVDMKTLALLRERLTQQLAVLEQEFERYLGPEARTINFNSPKQIAQLLFETLKLQPLKKTSSKTGYSTDQEVLEHLARAHPVPALLLAYREVQKLKSTYVDGLPQYINPRTGKIHTTFSQTIVATGRLSSSDPNLQNIPVTSPVPDVHIREAFVADEGCSFISADYSQIELRVLAYFSKDVTLCEAFLRGDDIHTRTAAGLFGVDINAVTQEQRQVAKRINFSILYGLTPYGLSQDLSIPLAQAKQYIERYVQTYPEVFTWMDTVVEETLSCGYVTTEWGRRRYVPELFERNKVLYDQGRRIAINTKVQGTAAEIMKLGMLAVDAQLKHAQRKAYSVLQIHDELVLQAPDSEVSIVSQEVTHAMESVVQWNIPLVVSVQSGKTWYNASK